MTKFPGPLAQIGPDPAGAADIDELDRRFCALASGTARLRLNIGELLEHLGSGGVRALGFPTVKAYAEERCGRSGRWAEEARCLARRLMALPVLRRALLNGEVTWSAANLVARHANPESEAELVMFATSQTLRALRVRLQVSNLPPPRQGGGGGGEQREQGASNDTPPRRRTFEHMVDAEEAWAFERTKMLLGAVMGGANQDEIIEAALAETWTELLPAGDECRELERAVDLHKWRCEARQVDAEVRTNMEAYFEHVAAPRPADVCANEPAQPILPSAPDTPGDIDKMIREACEALAGRDLELGRLAHAMDLRRGWKTLGYHSFGHFTRERLGWSVSSVRAKMALARTCGRLPALGCAVRDGRLGFETAALVGRVATSDTVTDWIDRAEARTVKHLREDVEVAGVLARASGDSRWLAPPDDEAVAAIHDLERAISSADQMSAGQGEAGESTPTDERRAPAPRKTGRVPVRVSLPSDLADLWSAVRALHQRLGPETSFFIAMWAAVARHWIPPRDDRPFADIYRRDRYRCQSPVCRGRDVDAHHIVFRAHGGGDEAENLVALCGICHLDLVHGHHLRVTGRAPFDLRWDFGGETVRGRVH